MDNTKKRFIHIDEKSVKWFMISFFIGFLCHSTTFYNTLIFHDDSHLRFEFTYETPIQNGRWFFGLLVAFLKRFIGNEGLAVFYGVITLTCIALIFIVICHIFELCNASKIAIAIIINVLPVVTSNFGYTTTSIYNFIGYLLCVIGVALISKSKTVKNAKYIVGILLLTLSIAEYQCQLCVAGTYMIMLFMQELLKQRDISWGDYFKRGFYYIVSLFFSTVLYIIGVKISLVITNIELTSYAGISSYGIVSVREYMHRIKLAYYYFLKSARTKPFSIFPFSCSLWHRVFLVVLFVIAAIVVFQLFRSEGLASALKLMIIYSLIPLAINSMFILYEAKRVHSLHTYSYIGFYLFVILLCEQLNNNKRFLYIIKYFAIAYIMMMGVLYYRYDNLCYFQMEIMQERGKVYYTELKTRIQSIDGYDVNYPILFINRYEEKNSDEFQPSISTSDTIVTNPFSGNDIPNGYAWDHFMEVWTGWAPAEVNSIDSKFDTTIEQMPNYPNDGSIRILDHTVVVKF